MDLAQISSTDRPKSLSSFAMDLQQRRLQVQFLHTTKVVFRISDTLSQCFLEIALSQTHGGLMKMTTPIIYNMLSAFSRRRSLSPWSSPGIGSCRYCWISQQFIDRFENRKTDSAENRETENDSKTLQHGKINSSIKILLMNVRISATGATWH